MFISARARASKRKAHFLKSTINFKESLLKPLLLLLLPLASLAHADTWNLPQKLSTENTKVNFEVDSTWHLVKGTVKHLDGELHLSDPKDFRSLQGILVLPISSFDTDNESRDEKLRDVMHTTIHPNVTFEFTEYPIDLCDPKTLSSDQSCWFQAPGKLTINDISRRVVLDSQVTVKGGSYEISGTTVIRWEDFKIDDPSILIAKLYDEVKILFTVKLSETNSSAATIENAK